MTDLTRLRENGGNGHFLRVQRAIFTAVDDFAAPIFPGTNSRPHPRIEVLVVPARLQQPRLLHVQAERAINLFDLFANGTPEGNDRMNPSYHLTSRTGMLRNLWVRASSRSRRRIRRQLRKRK